MRAGKVNLPEIKPKHGKVAKQCNRCGGRHAGGTTQCDLVPIYSMGTPAWARREVAEMIEDYDDERASL